MRAVTFQGPGQVLVEDVLEPELLHPGDAIVRVQATGVCGSDLHIFHGRVKIEPGFVIGHEYVGTVLAVGSDVQNVQVGERVLGCFQTACGRCYFCRNSWFHKCDASRTFGHGATLGGLPGTQAEQALVPNADLVLRHVPEGMSDDVALFAGDVMGTGFHAIADSDLKPGDVAAVLGLGPVGLCAVQAARAAGAAHVIAVDSVAERLAMAESFGAHPVHLTDGDPRGLARELTSGRGVDVCIDAVGHPQALDLAVRLTRKCGTVQAVVHMGLVWIKSLRLCCGHANVIAHVDRVLAMMSAGLLDPSPLVTHHMGLEDAPEAYALYDKREALKIVLKP
jgi:threonine dehydrogenase-like Zn-dependent dehydrogenase